MRTAYWLGGAILLVGCHAPSEPSTEACMRLFRARMERAEIVRVTADPHRNHVAIAYQEDGQTSAAGLGNFACTLRRARSGGFRIESATVDGKRLVDQWALVVNADLVLDELRRHGAREPQS